jgi:predicted nucleotidyltransferase
MKYQKSMLKIYEELVRQPFREFIIEEIIKEAGVGRTSGFEAIRWLEKNHLIDVRTSGKQKSIKLVINDVALNFKLFLNSIEIKKLDPNILFQINLFVDLVSKIVSNTDDVKAILLFGSASTFVKHPKDIDLEVVYKESKYPTKTQLKHVRKLIENISDFTINLHFTTNPDYHDLLQKIVVYNKSYYSDLFREKDSRLFNLRLQYREAVFDIDSISNNINDNALLPELIQRLIRNLAYCCCMVEEKRTETKNETIKYFMKKYKNRMKKFDKLSNIKKFNILRKITNEIGQKIFT